MARFYKGCGAVVLRTRFSGATTNHKLRRLAAEVRFSTERLVSLPFSIGTVHTFSQRTAWDLTPSDLSIAVAGAKQQGRDLLDLTVSNPTVCGFTYDPEILQALVTSAGALTYDPDPRGLRSARESVAAYYADHAAEVDPDAILLTTSTSEAYSFLFRLLCDPGDEVLVAQPSYPLFDFLATLDDIRLTPYPLFYDFGWWIDFAELERRVTSRTRAILLVHPNNPTGHWTHMPERQQLEEFCFRHNLALIVDEVFLDYPCGSISAASSFAIGPHPVLTFVLSGISKIAALPQMKVAWFATFGPDAVVTEALARLEVISDTFLSMNAPVQTALPAWLAARQGLQCQIRSRVAANLAALSRSPLELLHLEAGWAAIVRLRESDAALRLLSDQDVVVHPGAFYGMTDSRLIVMSLITPAPTFAAGIGQLSSSFAPSMVQRSHTGKHGPE